MNYLSDTLYDLIKEVMNSFEGLVDSKYWDEDQKAKLIEEYTKRIKKEVNIIKYLQ